MAEAIVVFVLIWLAMRWAARRRYRRAVRGHPVVLIQNIVVRTRKE